MNSIIMNANYGHRIQLSFLWSTYRQIYNMHKIKYFHSLNDYWARHFLWSTINFNLSNQVKKLPIKYFHRQLRSISLYSSTTKNNMPNQIYSQDYLENISSEGDQFLYQEFEFMKDDEFQDLLCPKLYANDIDPVMLELANIVKIKDIFKIIGLNQNRLDKNYVVQAVISISTLKTVAEQNRLNLKYYGQSLVQNDTTKISDKLKSFSEFNDILVALEKDITKLSNEELSATFMCLNNLGISLHENVMVALHLQLLKNINLLDITSLTRISFVFRGKGIKAYYTQAKILSKIALKLENCTSLNDFKNISIAVANMKKLLPKDLTLKYFSLLREFVNTKLDDCSISFKILFLKYIHLLSKHDFPADICRKLANTLIDDVFTLSPGQTITLNASLLKQLEPRNLQFKLQEYTSRICDDFKEDIDLRTDLLMCLLSHPTHRIKEKCEIVPLQKKLILYNHFNMFPLTGLNKSININDTDLYKQLWNQTVDNIKQNLLNKTAIKYGIGTKESTMFLILLQYISLNSNLRRTYGYNEIEEEIISLVEEELLSISRFIPTRVAHLSGFLLTNYGKITLTKEFYMKLLHNSMQFNSYDVLFLSNCIKYFFNDKQKNKENFKIVAKICGLLDAITVPLLNKSSSLSETSALTKAFLLRQSSSTSELFDILIHGHLKHLDQLNSFTISTITNILKSTRYANPQISVKLGNYIIENEESVIPNTIYHVLSYFYLVGYQPSNCEEFTTACRRILEMTTEKMESLYLLESCLAQAFFKNLSGELIHYIFNTKFLDILEDEIFSTQSKKHSFELKSLLMQLNRAVCLDFPEFRVPWFHEEYCQKTFLRETSYISDFHHDVHNCLVSILGSENVVSINRKSHYYYNLDLEFALDTNGKPVSIYDRNLKSSKSSIPDVKNKAHQKIAVQIRDEDSYTCNNTSLTGQCEMERRHLEILGYAVVEVPHFKWYSMALTNDEHRRKLLKSLIYEELSRIL